MNTLKTVPVIALANKVIAHVEIASSEGLHAAGWALAPRFMSSKDMDLMVRASLFMDYYAGRVMLVEAGWERDMITGKPLFISGDEVRGDIRIVHKEQPFFGIAQDKLTDAIAAEPARTYMSKLGIKLRGLSQLSVSKEARKDYYASRNALKPVVIACEAIARTLVVGAKATQERTLAKALVNTPLESLLSLTSHKHLTIDQVQDVIGAFTFKLDELRSIGFDPLKPITSVKLAKKIVKHASAAWAINAIAKREAVRLHRQRFWLAFALTNGELYERITHVTPDLMEVSAILEKSDDPHSLLGYYDHFEYTSDDRGDYAHAIFGETPEAQEAQVRVLKQDEQHSAFVATIEDLVSIMTDDGDDYYEDNGTRVSTNVFASGGSSCFEEVLDAGLIPVSYNRAKAIETKIDKLQIQKAVLEGMARAIGKRADDYDWAIEQSDFDLLDMKEDARKLMLPTQAEKDLDEGAWVNPTRAKVEVARAKEIITQQKRFF